MNISSVLSVIYSVCSVCNYKHKIYLYSHLDGACVKWYSSEFLTLWEQTWNKTPDIEGCVCRRVNVAGLRLLFLERAAYKGDLLLASSVAALGMSPVNRKLCLDHLYSVLYAKLHFLSGSLRFWCTVGRCCLCDQPWRKAVGSESGLPWAEALHTCQCIFLAEGRVSSLWPHVGAREHKEVWT